MNIEKIVRVNDKLNYNGMLEVDTEYNSYNLKVVPVGRSGFEIEIKKSNPHVLGCYREFTGRVAELLVDAQTEVKKLVMNDYVFNRKVVRLFR